MNEFLKTDFVFGLHEFEIQFIKTSSMEVPDVTVTAFSESGNQWLQNNQNHNQALEKGLTLIGK
jgi:hypothetical protein